MSCRTLERTKELFWLMRVAEFLVNSPMLYLLAGSRRGRLELTGRGMFSWPGVVSL